MANIWISSDLHIGHRKILEYSHRPFATIEEHDEALIENFNARVRPCDLLLILGDFSLAPPQLVPGYVKRFNGTKHLVAGNHDRFLKDKKRDFGFGWVGPYKEIKFNKTLYCLMHYPMLSWRSSFRGSVQLHGHTHQVDPIGDPAVRRINVGVDAHQYKPVSIEEIEQIVAKVNWKPKDHHDL